MVSNVPPTRAGLVSPMSVRNSEAQGEDLGARGAAIARRAVERVEALQSDLAQHLLNAVARKYRVSPYHLALRVPGVCHEHSPTSKLVHGCAYCRRRGNVTATD